MDSNVASNVPFNVKMRDARQKKQSLTAAKTISPPKTIKSLLVAVNLALSVKILAEVI